MGKVKVGFTAEARSNLPIVTVLFFFSGISSLILETVFCRLLAYTFGNTAAAVSTVLAGFLGGLALGAWALGVWSDGKRLSLAAYGWLEGLVAAYALCVGKVFTSLTSLYVAVCHHFQFGSGGLVAVRFCMAMLVVLPASFLMGGTLPVLSQYAASRDRLFRNAIDRLYAWNTLGAAAGTIVSTYAFLPLFGLSGAIGIACGINLCILLAASVLSVRDRSFPEMAPKIPDDRVIESAAVDAPRKLLLIGAFATGAGALGYEVIWTHVQAFTIGNSVYAFGVTLFVVLCGLGLGAQIVSRNFGKPETWAFGLAGSQFLLGTVTFLTLPLWGKLPILLGKGYVTMIVEDASAITLIILLTVAFVYVWIRRRGNPAGQMSGAAVRSILMLVAGLAFIALAVLVRNRELLVFDIINGGHSTVLFVGSEFLRFLCAFSLLIVPTVLLGVAFPLLLNLYAGTADHAGASVGSVYGWNTLGAIAGSILTGFVLIPRIGSEGTLRSLATLNVVLAVVFLAVLVRSWRTLRSAWAPAVSVALVLIGWVGLGQWNPKLICNDAYVYLVGGFGVDRVLYQKEDAAGGMTSVIQSGGARILLSNGKFQGDNTSEEAAQVRFALIPAMFAHRLNNGLVIGLGTGQTLYALSRLPFKRIDVAEMAPQIVEAARKWFTDVNGGVLDSDPRVHLSIADGRNFLLLSERKYDVITIEVSSIWIDGEADLYNKEFYDLCARHLSEGGVLQQWVQLHHMPRKNLLVILNTAARSFPHLAFFIGNGGQGLLIASRQPLNVDYDQLRAMDSSPTLQPALKSIHVPSVESLLGDLVLYDSSVRTAVFSLPEIARRPSAFVSSDWHPYLEYETPKGNAQAGNTLFTNIVWLQHFRPAILPAKLVVRNASNNQRKLLANDVLSERRETPCILPCKNTAISVGYLVPFSPLGSNATYKFPLSRRGTR